MPKKSKGTKSNTTANEPFPKEEKKETYDDLIKQDPQFHKGSSKFTFPNGDEYEGEFCAHASGLVWRQGRGTYTTNDGQIYIGEWDGDKLDETKGVDITYPDGSRFIGNLLNNKYSGSGIYQLEDKVSLMCNFVENKPCEDITLIDPNDKVWHGCAETDESLLIPEHPFYRCIGKDLGKGRHKLLVPKKTDSGSSFKGSQKSDESKGQKYRDLRQIEKQVFAKTKKTPADLQFENSEWYQDYVNYKKTYGQIFCKAKNQGEASLTPEENNWYVSYKEFENKYKTILNNYKNKIKKPIQDKRLFELIQSQGYMPKSVPVFYPREESDDDCNSSCECN